MGIRGKEGWMKGAVMAWLIKLTAELLSGPFPFFFLVHLVFWFPLITNRIWNLKGKLGHNLMNDSSDSPNRLGCVQRNSTVQLGMGMSLHCYETAEKKLPLQVKIKNNEFLQHPLRNLSLFNTYKYSFKWGLMFSLLESKTLKTLSWMVIPALPSHSIAITWNKGGFISAKTKPQQGCKLLYRSRCQGDCTLQSLRQGPAGFSSPCDDQRHPLRSCPAPCPHCPVLQGQPRAVLLQTFHSGSQVYHQSWQWPQVATSWNHSQAQRWNWAENTGYTDVSRGAGTTGRKPRGPSERCLTLHRYLKIRLSTQVNDSGDPKVPSTHRETRSPIAHSFHALVRLLLV